MGYAAAYRTVRARDAAGTQRQPSTPARRIDGIRPNRRSPWRPVATPRTQLPRGYTPNNLRDFGTRGLAGSNLASGTAFNGFALGRSAARIFARVNPLLAAGLAGWELWQALQPGGDPFWEVPAGWTLTANCAGKGPGGMLYNSAYSQTGMCIQTNRFITNGDFNGSYNGNNAFSTHEVVAHPNGPPLYKTEARRSYFKSLPSAQDPVLRYPQPKPRVARRKNIGPKPKYNPDPMSEPIPAGEPLPLPEKRPVPYEAIPDRKPNPYRDAREQTRSGYEPGGQTSTGPALRGLPNALRRRPGTRTKEPPKLILSPAAKSWLGMAVNAITEAKDLTEAVYKGLPKHLQHYGKDKTLQAKIEKIYRNPDKLDMRRVVYEILLNQLEDAAFGKLGQINAKANRARNATAGNEMGPNKGEFVDLEYKDGDGPADWEKYVDPDYYYEHYERGLDALEQIRHPYRGDLKYWGGTGDPRYTFRNYRPWE